MSDKPDWAADARALCDAATPGPWLHEGNGAVGAGHRTNQVAMACGLAAMHDERATTGEVLRATGEFIATARTALPRALTALEAADALAKALAECDRLLGGSMPDGLLFDARAALATYREARR